MLPTLTVLLYKELFRVKVTSSRVGWHGRFVKLGRPVRYTVNSTTKTTLSTLFVHRMILTSTWFPHVYTYQITTYLHPLVHPIPKYISSSHSYTHLFTTNLPTVVHHIPTHTLGHHIPTPTGSPHTYPHWVSTCLHPPNHHSCTHLFTTNLSILGHHIPTHIWSTYTYTHWVTTHQLSLHILKPNGFVFESCIIRMVYLRCCIS